MTRGGRVFSISMLLLYLGLGIAVPAVVIASRGEAEGGTGPPRQGAVGHERGGKQLFIQTCKSCHTLPAVNAHGVTGPNLDELGGVDKQRVLHAIEIGGTGDGRMPPQLLPARTPTRWPPTSATSPAAERRRLHHGRRCKSRCI